MTEPGGAGGPPQADRIPRLDELTDEITRRLQAGEAFDADAYCAQYAEWAEPVRDLLPTMHDLIELGRTVALLRRAGAEPGPTDLLTRKEPLS